MKVLRRLTLLGSFAAVGIALAVCVGVSAKEPPQRKSPPRSEPAVERAAADEPADDEPPGAMGGLPALAESRKNKGGQAAHGTLFQGLVEGGPSVNPPAAEAPQVVVIPPPVAASPLGPLAAEPYPALAQQFVPEAGRLRLEEISELLRRQLNPRLALPRAPEPPIAGSAGQPAAAVPEPTPVAPAPEAPLAEATIDGEGDDNLSIHIPPGSDIRDVLDLLSEEGNLNILAGKSVQGTISATLNGVDIDSALDAILKATGLVARRQGKFIFVGTPEEIDTLEQAMDTVGTRIYRPNYVTAAELQTLITPMLTETVGNESIGKISVSSPAEGGIATGSDNVGGDGYAGGDVLVVRDYEKVLAEIDQVVDEVDIRPLQVHIEAMILSVLLSDGNEFGVNFEMLRGNDNARLGWGSVGESTPRIPGTPAIPAIPAVTEPRRDVDGNLVLDPRTNEVLMRIVQAAVPAVAAVAAVPALTAVHNMRFDGNGLKFGFLDSGLGAFLNALESIGEMNIVATPSLMVVNKHRAEIHIGEELGYISTTVTENSATQTVEFLSVGAQLRLRPFISSDGMIRMEIHPELSTGAVTIEQGFTIPNKETTQVTTNIMVRDGCTVVIGGLIREQLETTISQVPLFGSLPLIGPAFRSKREKLLRREVIVLITPRIVYEPETCEEGEKTACEFKRRQGVYADRMSPLIGKRSIGRRYFRLAQNAWASGDRDTALRFAEMSVHFDPLSLEAIELRSDIWNGKPYSKSPLGIHAAAASPAGPMDGQAIDGWLLDEMERTPGQPRPFDPGQPGPRKDITLPRKLQ